MKKNPVLSGFYPDPSVCRVDDDYYLINSTFAFFPAVPIFHSKNLTDWTQIGNILDRPSQVKLESCGHSQGIFAPTITFYNGMFYMITTNVSGGGNFIVTAKKPEGPWSEPYYLGENVKGIDPNLFFDDNGTCYYVGTQERREGGKYYGDNEIWIQELDLKTMKLVGESTAIWHGFMKDAVWPEGPHIYKKDGFYYLLYAESGTAFHHCIAVARSRNILGPYEGNKSNPIFTHRHLGRNFPITCVGHADLVDDGNGNWYMLMLACRPEKGYTLMGRETFIADVKWEDGWPVVNAGVGYLQMVNLQNEKYKHKYELHKDKLPLDMLMLRSDCKDRVKVFDEYIRLYMKKETMTQTLNPAFVGIRQQHKNFQFTVECNNSCEENEFAGIVYMQNEKEQVRLEITKDKIKAIDVQNGEENIISVNNLNQKNIKLKVQVYGLNASVLYEENGSWNVLASNIDLRHLSTEKAGGFTGCVVGVYASGKQSDNFIDFKEFTYEEL